MSGARDPRARERRAPFRLYLVSVELDSGGLGRYVATRVVRAQDADGASSAALCLEVERAAGVAAAGMLPPHPPLRVLRVRRIGRKP